MKPRVSFSTVSLRRLLCAVTALASLTSACSMNTSMTQGATGPHCPAAPEDPGLAAEGPAVKWYVPAQAGDRSTLDEWCRTVGPAAIVLEPPTPPAEWEDRITVAIWNMWIGGGDLRAFLAQELGFVCGEPAANAPPFAVLLQEVYRQSSDLPPPLPTSAIPFLIEPGVRPGGDIVEEADACGLSLVYVPSARNGGRIVDGVAEDKGNAILSNLPLTDPIAVVVPFEAGRKVAVGATVHGAGGPLRIVSLHLDVASSLLRTLVTGYGTRVRQAEGLANGIDLADPPFATVVAGDFNSWSDKETALLRVHRRYPDGPDPDPTPTRGFLPTDQMFFRADPAGRLTVVPGSYQVIEEGYGSDHNGRRLEIAASPSSPDPR